MRIVDYDIKMFKTSLFILIVIIENLSSESTHAMHLDCFVKTPAPMSGTVIELLLSWKGLPDEPWTSDPVEIAFLDSDDRTLFTDCHNPIRCTLETIPSGWELAYYVPILFPVFKTSVTAKIHVRKGVFEAIIPGDIIFQPALSAPTLDPPGSTELISGWHDLERDSNSGEVWRWMADRSSLTFTNPFRTCFLFLKAEMPIAEPGGTNGLHIKINGVEVDYFMPGFGKFNIAYDIPPFLLKYESNVVLELIADWAFSPSDRGESDARRLGLKLLSLHIR